MLNFVMAILWIGFVVLPVAVNFKYSNVSGHFAVIHLIDGEVCSFEPIPKIIYFRPFQTERVCRWQFHI